MASSELLKEDLEYENMNGSRRRVRDRDKLTTVEGRAPRQNELYHGTILLNDGTVRSMPAAERFRILRARIERHNLGGNAVNVLAVTSAVPEEGKSVVAVNLARALSIDPVAKVLLIDCDMRRPTDHEFFNTPREPGLGDALVSRASLNSVIQSVGRGLDFIPAGTALADPALAIEQPIMERFIYELKKYYRYIIIDCPPVLLCPEPITLTSITEGTLLVVRGWRTEKRLVQDAVDIVGKQNILGVVMNDGMDSSKQYRYYRYYDSKPSDQSALTKAEDASTGMAKVSRFLSKDKSGQ